MIVLAVFAHADDETLGAGGTLARHVAQGDDVGCLTFTDGVSARGESWRGPRADVLLRDVQSRNKEWIRALRCLGASEWAKAAGFPDQRLDTVPILHLAQCVERAVREFAPETIYTHWHGDLNRDHQCVAEAVFVATRLAAGSRVARVLACEIPESTSQAFGLGAAFAPNLYVDISAHLIPKLEALRCYESERREPPHPRSQVGIVTHAGARGGEAGCDFAEAFMIMREVRR